MSRYWKETPKLVIVEIKNNKNTKVLRIYSVILVGFFVIDFVIPVKKNNRIPSDKKKNNLFSLEDHVVQVS